MDIYYSPYQLTPLKKANRLTSLDVKKGILLKATINGIDSYADYFPHLPLGDRSVDVFLSEFKEQKEEYDQKVLHFLREDHRYQKIPSTSFMNHQLWSGYEEISSPVIKYKLMFQQDTLFMSPLLRGVVVRLDGNGLFTKDNFNRFINLIPPQYWSQIEYIEDPSLESDWNPYPFTKARDFLTGSPFDVSIYKPNCEFMPHPDKTTVFSAYLGSDLGTWHAYCEMIEKADLSITQGIIGENFYQEQLKLFEGTYSDGMKPNLEVVKKIYQDLNLREWKFLCSI